MKYIFIINGCAGSGKDTAVSILEQQLSPVNIFNTSSVDYIKQIAKEYFDWDGVKDARGRKLLSDLKNAATSYNNLPFIQLVKHVQNAPDYSITCWHCREPKEIQHAKEWFDSVNTRYNAKTVLVRRESVENVSDDDAAGNGDVLKYEYDIIIYNNGTIEDLQYEVQAKLIHHIS